MLARNLGLAEVVATFFCAGFWLGACSTGESSMTPGAANSTTVGGSSSLGGSSSTSATASGAGSGSNSSISIGVAGAGASGTVKETVACTEGVDCTCPTLTVAVIGKPGKWGAPGGDSDTAFQEWLNSSSAGTAKADVFATKPAMTADFLSAYNVIILASLSDDSNIGPFWTFDSAEVAAFQDWVQNKGGGVITLTGYSGDGAETKPINQLTAFTGLAYNTDSVTALCLDWAVCGCAGSLTLSDWNKTDAVISNLSTGVTWVGFENGRSIVAPADAHVAATVKGNSNVAANALVGKIAGTGRVLMYGDEWITYTSQWTGAGITAANCTAGNYPQDKYQTAQFWFNMIKWVQPSATCFKIVDKEQPVTIW